MNQTEPTLSDGFKDLWDGKFYLLSGLIIGLLAAFIFMASATPYFKARMIVAPASPMNGAEMSSLLADNNLFALRYLVQRVGMSNSSDFLRFENIYAGPRVAHMLIKDETIIAGLKNDPKANFITEQKDWNADKLSYYLSKRLRLDSIGASPLRELSYQHPDKDFAVYLLGEVHQISDYMIRQNIFKESGERIEYLKRAIEETSNPEHRRALTTLLMEQERLRMLVSIDQAYAASVIEPPAALPKVSWPDKYLVWPGFALIGLFLGYVVYGIRKK